MSEEEMYQEFVSECPGDWCSETLRWIEKMVEKGRKSQRLESALEVATGALGDAHTFACNCCDSNENVKVYCGEALAKIREITKDDVL